MYRSDKSVEEFPIIAKLSVDYFLANLERHAKDACYTLTHPCFNNNFYKDVFAWQKLIDNLNSLLVKDDEIVIINSNGGKYDINIIKGLQFWKKSILVSYYVCDYKEIDEEFLSCIHKNGVFFIIILAIKSDEDIKNMFYVIKSVERYKPILIQFVTLGYSVDDENNRIDFSLFVKEVLHIRKSVFFPVLMFPELYIVAKFYPQSGSYIVGVIRESSFSQAGLLAGDILVNINSLAVSSRAFTKYVLSNLYRGNIEFEVDYIRNGKKYTTYIQWIKNNYHFVLMNPRVYFGGVINGILSSSLISEIKNIVNREKINKGLLVVSELTFELCNKIFNEQCKEIQVCIVTRENGCIIDMGNVFSVFDYRRAISKEKKVSNFECVLLPSSAFIDKDGKRLDYRGINSKFIEKLTNTRVCWVECGGVFL